MADVRRVEDGRGQPPDSDCDATAGQLVEERGGRRDFVSRGPPIRGLIAGMRRDYVPEEHLVLDAELGEHAVDDRRGRLCGAGARELALGRERDPADARAAIAGGLADEYARRAPTSLEIRTEPVAQVRRSGVLVVRLADPGVGEPFYEVQAFQRTSSSTVRRRCVVRLVLELQPGSGSGYPMLTPATSVKSSGIRRRSRSSRSSSPKIP